MKVLWRSRIAAEAARRLCDPQFEIIVETDSARAQALLADVTTLVDGRPEPALLDGPKLEHVIVPYVGIHPTLQAALRERPHLKLYNSHFNDRFVAQHAVAMLLACANQLLPADREMRAGRWRPFGGEGPQSLSLYGTSCLLAGYGAIGREVRRLLAGFEMRFSALKRSPEPLAELTVYPPGQLHAALAAADIVIVSLPATPETEGMFDAAAFAAMRPGSILINVGRGSVIDQRALYAALSEGKLRAAGLDVWWHYPEGAEPVAPAEVPLHELPNVLLSPHRAAHYEGWQEASFADVLATLRALAAGRERNRVDVARGY